MTNILVTGSNGQLGNELRELSKNYTNNFYFTDRASLDITNLDALNEFISSNKIDIIINPAAYTAVDKAQSDEENADAINHIAVKYLSK